MLPLFLVGVLALGATACGGDGNDQGATSPTASETPRADDMSDGMDDGMDDDHGSFEFGQPADAADADRTVAIEARDIAFEPTSVEVAVGEIITFVVTNTGAAVHEFTVGDSHMQDEHEEEMAGMDEGMMMADEPNAIAIAPGETKELTWHFTEAGEILYGCHQPGHYAAGMFGTITVA